MFNVIIIGGGAHGVLTALYLHSENKSLRIAIFEKAKKLLSTYSEKELFPFKEQMLTKGELEHLIQINGISVFKSSAITALHFGSKKNQFEITTRRSVYKGGKLVVSSGKDDKILSILSELGIGIEDTMPAAFPLESGDPRMAGLGTIDLPVLLSWVKMSLPKKKVRIKLASAIPETKPIKQIRGEIRVQTKKLSGPVVYNLTQFIVDELSPTPDLIKVCINWVPDYGLEGLIKYLKEVSQLEFHKTISRTQLFGLPRKLWTNMALAADIDRDMRWEELKSEQYIDLAEQLTDMQIITKPCLSKKGMIAFRGGVSSNSIHESGESLKFPGLFLAGTIVSDHLTHVKGRTKNVASSIKMLAKRAAE